MSSNISGMNFHGYSVRMAKDEDVDMVQAMLHPKLPALEKIFGKIDVPKMWCVISSELLPCQLPNLVPQVVRRSLKISRRLRTNQSCDHGDPIDKIGFRSGILKLKVNFERSERDNSREVED